MDSFGRRHGERRHFSHRAKQFAVRRRRPKRYGSLSRRSGISCLLETEGHADSEQIQHAEFSEAALRPPYGWCDSFSAAEVSASRLRVHIRRARSRAKRLAQHLRTSWPALVLLPFSATGARRSTPTPP